MDAKKGEAMTPERIDELARECAAKLSQPQYDMITSAEEEDRIRSDALDADAKAIAQALRTVAREVLEDAELAARLNEAWQAEMRRHLSLSGHTVYRGVRQAGEVFLRTEAAKYEEQSDG